MLAQVNKFVVVGSTAGYGHTMQIRRGRGKSRGGLACWAINGRGKRSKKLSRQEEGGPAEWEVLDAWQRPSIMGDLPTTWQACQHRSKSVHGCDLASPIC